MKAIRLHGVGDQRFEDLPVPQIRDDEVLIQVITASMDGTDLERIHGSHTLSSSDVVIEGHEYAGRVVEVADAVTRFEIGDRVTGPWGVHCQKCEYCRRGQTNLCTNQLHFGIDIDGSWADYMRVPEYVLTRLPDEISFDDGAMLCCIPPTVLRAIERSPIKLGDSVAVIGLGQVGLTSLMAARLAGADGLMAIDPISSRRDLASRLGATATFNPAATDVVEEIQEATDGRGANLCLVAASSVVRTGSRSLADMAFEVVAKGGQITFVGLTGEHTANFNRLISKEFSVVGAKALLGLEYVERALSLASSGRWDLDVYRKLITHTIELENLPEAMSGDSLTGAIKVLIHPNTSDSDD